MASFIAKVRSLYDVVLFDSAPLLPVTDAAILAARVSGAVVVANVNKVHRAQFSDGLRSIEQVGAKVLGVVLKGTSAKPSTSYYGYVQETSGRAHRAERRSRRSAK